LAQVPRRYTVEAGKSLTDVWPSTTSQGAYDLMVYAPNGFVRSFGGNSSVWSSSTFQPEILVAYSTSLDQLSLEIRNGGGSAGTLNVAANNAFLSYASQTVSVAAGGLVVLPLKLSTSGNWYDFTVSSNNFSRRFAGRMETGKDGISDPAFATIV
jgi:phospholipase C